MTPHQAYRLVRNALKRGELVRPEKCSRCGANPKTSDGRSAIQAHHSDYEKPLDVEWICPKCHRKETPLPEVMGAPAFGESNGQAKLTAKSIEEIRSSEIGCRKLARIYGVHKSTIQRVRNGTHWAAAPTPAAQGGDSHE